MSGLRGLLCHCHAVSQFRNFQPRLCPQPPPTFPRLYYVPRSNRFEFLPSFWSVTHNGPWCLEGPPERRPRMMRTVPNTMPTRPTVNPRAQTTVSVSSDIGTGISGSVKVKFCGSHNTECFCVCIWDGVKRGWFYRLGAWSLGQRVRSIVRIPRSLRT